MTDANPGWLAHCTEIKDLADLLGAPRAVQLEQASLLLVSDGQATLSINGHEEQLLFGQLIALEQGSVIRLAPANHLDFSGYLISFNTYDTEMQSPCDWQADRAAGYYVQSVPETVVAEVRIALTKSTEPLGTTMKQYILYHLLKELQQEQPAGDSTLEQRLARTVTYMQQNYHQMMTRDELAAIAGYSPSYYSRKFTQLYHKTPVEYLTRYRMYRAQEWLLLTEDSSKQVARKAGYEDAQYFSRQFRRLAGMPPKQFKSTIAERRICFLSAAHAEIAKEKLHQALGDQTILVLRVEQKQYRVLGQEAGSPGSGILYNELGLHIPEQLKDHKEWFTPMSLEIFPTLKADHIFVEQRMMQNYSSEQSMKDLENSPIWQAMEAVQKGHVYSLKTADFVVGEGLAGTPLFLDYLVGKLVSR